MWHLPMDETTGDFTVATGLVFSYGSETRMLKTAAEGSLLLCDHRRVCGVYRVWRVNLREFPKFSVR